MTWYLHSLREWDFKEVVPGQNSIGRPKKKRRMRNPPLRKKKSNERKRKGGERENAKKERGGRARAATAGRRIHLAMTRGRAQASVRVCVLSLARVLPACVHWRCARRGQQCQITGYVASAKLIARRPEFPPGLHPPAPRFPFPHTRVRRRACMAALGWTPKRIRIIDRHGTARNDGRVYHEIRPGADFTPRAADKGLSARADFRRVDLRPCPRLGASILGAPISRPRRLTTAPQRNSAAPISHTAWFYRTRIFPARSSRVIRYINEYKKKTVFVNFTANVIKFQSACFIKIHAYVLLISCFANRFILLWKFRQIDIFNLKYFRDLI